MPDLILDVGPLADLLAQYFKKENRYSIQFEVDRFLSPKAVQHINYVVSQNGFQGIIGASALAFVELVHKWDKITLERFRAYQMASFLEEHPDWFSIEPMDETIFPLVAQVPADVTMPDGTTKSIEWADAIHAATTLGRDNGILVTSDEKLAQIPELRSIFVKV